MGIREWCGELRICDSLLFVQLKLHRILSRYDIEPVLRGVLLAISIRRRSRMDGARDRRAGQPRPLLNAASLLLLAPDGKSDLLQRRRLPEAEQRVQSHVAIPASGSAGTAVQGDTGVGVGGVLGRANLDESRGCEHDGGQLPLQCRVWRMPVTSGTANPSPRKRTVEKLLERGDRVVCFV